MRTSQEKADQAIQKLMIKEGGGKLSVPKSVESSKSAKTALKRPASSSDEGSPRKKPREERPRNKQKLKNNVSSSVSNSLHATNSSQSHFGSLPNVFKGDKIFISSKIAEKELLSRYVVAYGGNLVDDKKLADVIVLSKSIPDKLGRIVTKQWIIDKINQ